MHRGHSEVFGGSDDGINDSTPTGVDTEMRLLCVLCRLQVAITAQYNTTVRNCGTDLAQRPSHQPHPVLNSTCINGELCLTADAESAVLRVYFRTFMTRSHILHYQSVLDAYGHLSFRHPSDLSTFFMSRYVAPGTISSRDDLIEYHVSNAEPVDPTSTKGYSERHIHSEIYKRHPSVHAAVHSHSEDVVPYTISGVPLRPCYHMAGFLRAEGAPVYEISEHYGAGDRRDMLVRSERLGAALAEHFDGGVAVALMRGHGFTAVGGCIEEVVLRSIYTQKNAAIQTAAMASRAAHAATGGQVGGTQGMRYLSEQEAAGATEMTEWSAQRPWKLWVREVEACGLYVNSA